MKKQFKCNAFNPALLCNYEITGDEAYVVQQADKHVIEEHEYQDSPALQQQIADSLVDVP